MWTTMASLGKTKWERSVILFLVPCFSSWCLWVEMWHYTELPPACSVQCIIPCCFGGELFAVKWMLRNGIAIYGNRAFLCTVSSLPFPLNDICNEEGRIELFAPNREEGLDGFVHQQHERHKGFHPSEPGKSSMKISEMASGDRHVTASQAWPLWLRGSQQCSIH